MSQVITNKKSSADMPSTEELERLFTKVLALMDLPPDKSKVLWGYENERKWEIIKDQGKVTAKQPPEYYITKLLAFLDPKSTKSLRRRRPDNDNVSTQLLRDLEISLRTNSIEWVREFLSPSNRGLDVLVDYFAAATMHTFPKHNVQKSRLGDVASDLHVCIMCLRAIMNNKYGFNLVMEHSLAINCLALSLNHQSARTKTLVLELLAAVCLVKGGHELIMNSFDNFKEVCHEHRRFETLMRYFTDYETFNVDFMVSCLQFINIIVHSVEDMNYRLHLQYEFTQLGLDDYLECKLKNNESEELQVQIHAYLDNILDVSTIVEEAEQKSAIAEQYQQLSERYSMINEANVGLQTTVANLENKCQELERDRHKLIEAKRHLEAEVQYLKSMISKNKSETKNHVSKLEAQIQQLEQQRRLNGLKNTAAQSTSQRHRIRLKLDESENIDCDASNDPSLSTTHRPGHQSNSAPPPPPLPNFPGTNQVTQTTTTAAAPPPPPPPPLPSFDGSGNHVGVDSTKSSSLVAASGNKRSLTSSSTTSSSCLPPPPPPPPLPQTGAGVRLPTKNKSSTANMASTTNQATNIDMMTLKKAFSTKYKLPTFNWITLKPNQVRGTIFNEFHEEDKILKTIDFSEFEEQFKLSTKPDRSNSPNADNLPMGHQANGSSVGSNNSVGAGATDDSTGATKRFKQNEKTTFLEHNRLRNMAISLRKIGLPTDVVIRCLNTFDTYPLPLDTIEILQRMMPQHKEIEAYQEYERSGKPLDDLTDEDKFLAQMSKVERLDQKLKIMFYMKNLTTNAAGEYIGASPSPDSGLPSRQSDTSSMCGDSNSNYSVATSAGVASVIDTLRAKLINIESASRQLRQSEGMKILLEYILIFGNYLNSSARGLASAPAYGFKLQALDMVMDSKSTQDRTRSLMHFLVDTIMKNLVPKEQGKLDTSGDIDGSANGQQPSKRLLPPGTPMARGLLSTGLHGDDQVRMPYNFDTLLLLLEKAASISLETIVSEVAELEKGMELCLKELQLRGFSHPVNSSSKSSSGAMIDVPNSPSGSPVPRACSPAPLMAGTTNDEAARRLSQFIKSKCGEVNDLKETLRQAQNEFSECAQYFGENPRLIESSSLFSVFFRLLKNFRQCQLDNRLAQKRKFDEELRKQIVQQQAQRASNRKQPNGSRSERSKPAEVNATSPKIKPDTRLLHQEEVSHGTLDFLITGLKVEPYRRADGMRRSKRSDVPVYSYMSP